MKIIQNGDIIMVKGSNSVGLNKLTTKILSEKKVNLEKKMLYYINYLVMVEFL